MNEVVDMPEDWVEALQKRTYKDTFAGGGLNN
jgi:hypothetical protein